MVEVLVIALGTTEESAFQVPLSEFPNLRILDMTLQDFGCASEKEFQP